MALPSRSSTTKLFLHTIELLTVEFGVNHSGIWKKFVVDDTSLVPPNTKKDLLLSLVDFWHRERFVRG